MKLSQKIENLSESQTIAMNRQSRELREKGVDVISLSLGEPDFTTPKFICNAAKKAIDQNFSHYPPIAGYKDLREAIAHKFQRDNNLNYDPEQIVVSTGAKQSIANVVLCLINPGDEVLLPAPYWVSYYEIVKLAGGVPVVIPTSIEDDFKVNEKRLQEFTNSRTKLMIYSSPCNPSGSVYSEEELEGIARWLRKNPEVMTISDEIYELINFGGSTPSLATDESIYDQVITINGLSKGFAMTGWRLGYLGAPLALAKACDKMQGQFTSAACSITQRAAIAALQANPQEVAYMKEAFAERRALVTKGLTEIPGFEINNPKGAFYIFPRITALLGKKFKGEEIKTSADLCMYLLREGGVGLVPGEAFGSPDCLRISYAAAEEELKEALQRIAAAIKKLQ